jgi:putative flippase GtrA
MNVAVAYALFAIIAIIANILAQDIFLKIYQAEFAISLSILCGTAVGLVLKYWLDKRFIFRFVAKNLKQHGRTFMLYAVMGVLTTLIFWGTEWAFELMFQTKEMRYLGGVLGLVVGYMVKYFLDKKYVFVS